MEGRIPNLICGTKGVHGVLSALSHEKMTVPAETDNVQTSF